MQTSAAVMRSLAAVAIIAFTISIVAAAEKVSPCCTRVSKSRVVEPIRDFKIQERNLPCIKAVIFETEKERFCVDPRQPWVRQKVEELIKARKTTASPKTDSPTTASPTTDSPTTASRITASPTIASRITASPTTAFPTTASPNSVSPDPTSSTLLS